jgi:hypothetical protein
MPKDEKQAQRIEGRGFWGAMVCLFRGPCVRCQEASR